MYKKRVSLTEELDDRLRQEACDRRVTQNSIVVEALHNYWESGDTKDEEDDIDDLSPEALQFAEELDEDGSLMKAVNFLRERAKDKETTVFKLVKKVAAFM